MLNESAAVWRQQGRVVRALDLPLTGFVHGSPEFKSSATLVNSQLVCLLPVGILNPAIYVGFNYLFHVFARPH